MAKVIKKEKKRCDNFRCETVLETFFWSCGCVGVAITGSASKECNDRNCVSKTGQPDKRCGQKGHAFYHKDQT